MILAGIAQVLHLERADSTQTLARALADGGAPAGTLVRADRQAAGRGRLARRWQSPAGGLYFSLILRPAFAPKRLADFSLRAGAELARSLERLTGTSLAVKPPNDVYSAGPGKPRKLCGILAEAAGTTSTLEWLVVGVGVNVNARPGLSTAVSLKTLTGRAWPLDQVLAAAVAALQRAAKAIER